MKQLIVDYLPFDIKHEQITESIKENSGRLIVKGVLQRADAKNQNGRVYPKETLMREAKKYAKEFISQRRAMGELDHPESSVVNLQNVSHNITEMHWEGDNLLGEVEVLGTPSGNILKELFKSGIKLGISSRGMGSVETVREAGELIPNLIPLLNNSFNILPDGVPNTSTSPNRLSPSQCISVIL
jgi:hypothetical protein